MLTIHLTSVRIFFFSWIVQEEKKQWAINLIVDVAVTMDAPERITKLKQTADYVVIYEIIHKRMQEATPLLETVAQDLADLIHHADNRIKSISISIKKLSPPINNFHGSVGISFKKEF